MAAPRSRPAGPLGVRWLARARAAPGRARRPRARRARERRHGRLARRLASPTTGSTSSATRSSGTACARRSRPLAPGRAREVEARRSRADAARPLPARLRPRRSSTALVLARSATRRSSARSRCCARDASRARVAHLPPEVEPAGDWHELVRAAHEEGYAAVGGAIESRPRRAARAPTARQEARNPRFPSRSSAPRCSPPLEPNARWQGSRPWRPRGRRALDLRRADRRSSTAIRSSTRPNTNAPSASATAAATTR